MKEYLPFLRAIAGGRVLEIGVCAGVSTSAFLLGMDDKRDGHLFSIDIKQECGLILSHPRWTFIHGDSLTMPIPEEPESFDVLLIDGEHDYASVSSDLRRFSPLVKRGGLILNHDLLPSGYEESRRGMNSAKRSRSGPPRFCRASLAWE